MPPPLWLERGRAPPTPLLGWGGATAAARWCHVRTELARRREGVPERELAPVVERGRASEGSGSGAALLRAGRAAAEREEREMG